MSSETYQKDAAGKELALEARANDEDRLYSPSAARNRDVLKNVFLAQMPTAGLLLEVGSGSGEHAAHIADALPDISWQPSDPDEASRKSIAAWAGYRNLVNIRAPLDLNVIDDRWFERDDLPSPLAAIMSVNMIHIAPFEAASGLIAGAGCLLAPGGKLFLYGPFKRYGETAPSNLDFDTSLKSRDPRWGVRDLDDEIIPLAAEAGLTLTQVVSMPANNLSVIFEKTKSMAYQGVC